MRRSNLSLAASAAAWFAAGAASPIQAATATFTPLSPTDVEIGTTIQFEISVAVAGLSGFNSADVIMGSNTATDLTFVYSPAWTTAFSSVNAPQYDVGFYNQSVFVGGNNAASVGTSIVLGTVTIHTGGMTAGTRKIEVNNAADGFSTLGLNGAPEPIFGLATFSVHRPVPAVSTWGLVILALSILILGTTRLRALDRFHLGCGATSLDGETDRPFLGRVPPPC